ncbi:MAG TPA: hypothetical protein VNT01_11075 [Symbiobacteriaceae bacterium]|nr:hypothetical protein [Symbiobacteriaceae bacterium]
MSHQQHQGAKLKTDNDRNVTTQARPSLDHGVPSSVAMDSPDDSQLGADRTQSKDSQA